ncbi:uncharacterized protein LOC125680596 [Ostrea edulis]|uniref:uncharacterized protein LOC125680596 n=1 Tax=Ostrea edulis TaxID=37623 RepID=UPI0020954BBF|nr:uncharacterized protein LOC125680596 [Ostrea edulis]
MTSSMDTRKQQEEYLMFLFQKIKKGEITLEEKETMKDFRKEFMKGVLFRSLPSSMAMYAVYRYRSKGGVVGVGKSMLCAFGGLFLGFSLTPTRKLWAEELQKHNITSQHVLGKIHMLQKNEMPSDVMDQDMESMMAERPEMQSRITPKFVEQMERQTDKPSDTQTNSGTSFLFGRSNQETVQPDNEHEGLMQKRLKRNRRKMTEDLNSSEGVSDSGKRVNKYGDVIE